MGKLAFLYKVLKLSFSKDLLSESLFCGDPMMSLSLKEINSRF